MLKNDDIVSIQQDLITRNYEQLLSNLRRIGRPIKQAWYAKLLREKDETTEKNKFTSNPAFKKFLVAQITRSNIPETANIKDIPQQIKQFKNQLSQLAIFLIVWKDDPNLELESEIEQLNLSATEKKKLRQLIKYKSSLDKDDRRAINIALQTMAFILCQQSNNFIKHQEQSLKIYANDRAFSDKDTKTKIIDVIDNKQDFLHFTLDHLKSLNNFEFDRYGETTNTVFSLDKNEKNQEIEKIGLAISSFQTPNKKKKLIKYAGILLAFIASLACGLSTGAEIFLLISNFPAAIILGAIIFTFGFYANFNFFSVNFPDFLLSLLKNGGISEYIDLKGKRQQFSATYKFLLVPVIVASITVGAGTIALTADTILNAVATILNGGVTILKVGTAIKLIISALAIIWPPLPLIIIGIIGILAVSVGITLTIAVLTASLGSMKKIAALNMTFTELCKYAYKNCKEWLENFKNLECHQQVGYIIMFLLLPLALFGLAYFRITAGTALAEFIGVIGAASTGVISYIAQIAFTVMGVNKLRNILKSFSSSSTPQEPSIPTTKSIASRVNSNFIYPCCIIGNAVGNAALVYNGSGISTAGAVACGFNSLAGNLSEPNMNQHNRNLATAALAKQAATIFNTSTTDASTSNSDPKSEETRLKFNLLNTKSDEYPQEPKVTLPSPTQSDDGRVFSSRIGKGNYTPLHFKKGAVENQTTSAIQEPRFATR
ncbi:MAG: hypothetical protein RJA83_1175 [Pseudomonadota bacterium]|jgi:hypothetical protein